MPGMDNPADNKPDTQQFLEIGRIPRLRPEIDQSHKDNTDNISSLLKKRMGIVDLFPCGFEVSMSTLNEPLSGFRPTLKYQKPIKIFKKKQKDYGLEQKEFLRIYLTDTSTVQDVITNQYSANVIDDTLNSMSSSRIGKVAKSIFQFTESTGQSLTDSLKDAASKAANSFGVKFDKSISQAGVDSASVLAKVITHGARISFPKIWSGASYDPQLNCNIKLVSPYGHPKAIAEFIIKPLGYLLLLLSPTTEYGITTTKPGFLTLKSYGMSNMTVCVPSSIEIRRGGDDSNFSQFKQPLVVDIALTFETATNGFGVYEIPEGETNPEKNIFEIDKLTSDFDSFDTDTDGTITLIPTLRNMINSFRPFGYTKTEGGGSNSNSVNNSVGSNSVNIIGGSNSGSGSGGIIGGGNSGGGSGGGIIGGGNSGGGGTETTTPIPDDDLDTELDEGTNVEEPPVVTVNPTDTSTDPETKTVSVETTNPTVTVESITATNDATSITNTNNPTSFVANEVFSDMSTSGNTQTLVVDSEFSESNEEASTYFRNIRSDGLPGLWSNKANILQFDNSNIIVDILPFDIVINEGIRWYAVDNESIIYGPYLRSANLADGTYTLRIVNIPNSTILHEEEIEVSSETNRYEVSLVIEYGSIKVTMNIFEETDISDFKYFLIPDTFESLIVGKISTTINDLQKGYYNIMVKYNNTDVLYNTGVSSLVYINEDVLNQFVITINENFKITSIAVV